MADDEEALLLLVAAGDAVAATGREFLMVWVEPGGKAQQVMTNMSQAALQAQLEKVVARLKAGAFQKDRVSRCPGCAECKGAPGVVH